MYNKQQLLAEAGKSITEFEMLTQNDSDAYIPPPDMSLSALAYDNLAPSSVISNSEGITFSKGVANKVEVEESNKSEEQNSGKGKKRSSSSKKVITQPVDSGISSLILDTLTQAVRSIHTRLDEIEFQLKEKDQAVEDNKEEENQESVEKPKPFTVEFRFGFGVKYDFTALTRHDYDDFIVLTVPQGSFKINIDSGSAPQDTYLSFNDGAEVIPGFLLGKPFCVDPTSNSTTELLIFLRNPAE